MVFNWLCDCKMMDAEISRLRMVAISLSNFGIRPMFANSSSSILKLSCSFFHYSPCILYCTTTSLYIDCYNNLYAGSPSYLLILFSALSAFAEGGLSIERNQKPLAPEITLAITHHNRQKQVEVKRSSRVNPHEIRIFSGCPYYFTLPMNGNYNSFTKHLRQPCKKSWSFGMNMYYIISSECAVKSRKKR